MDILVRLATEPPDLTGLPEELDGIVTACLARARASGPRRPRCSTSSGRSPRSGRAALGARLPARPAMAVISEYQHGPPAGRPRPADGDAAETTGRRAHGENGRRRRRGPTAAAPRPPTAAPAADADEAPFGSQVAFPAPPRRRAPACAPGAHRADRGQMAAAVGRRGTGAASP